MRVQTANSAVSTINLPRITRMHHAWAVFENYRVLVNLGTSPIHAASLAAHEYELWNLENETSENA